MRDRPLALDVHSAALLACEREPIRTPGGIQPHGALLVVGEQDMRVRYASDNLEAYLGRPARELLGLTLAECAPDRLDEAALALLSSGGAGRPSRLRLASPGIDRSVDVFAHRSGGQVVLELEDVAGGEGTARAMPVERADDPGSALAAALSAVYELCGFERVLGYRFEPDGHGVVVDERCAGHLSPLIGLHYPASDIPAQARALYRERRIRVIPDSSAPAVDLVGLAGEPPPAGIDLAGAVLRAVSPIHLQYLRNMGVCASMSISLVVEDELWGLIICHDHRGRRLVPYAVRAACEVAGLTASIAISAMAELAIAERRVELDRIGASLIERVVGAGSIAEGLLEDPALLLGVCEAAGVAVRSGGALRLAGATPDEADVERIIAAVGPVMASDVVYLTDALALEHPLLVDLAEPASGVLALRLPNDSADVIVWFRPERVRAISWAGDPQKAVEVSPEGTRWLAPRGSFSAWTEIVRGRAERWHPAAVAAVTRLRTGLGSL